MPVIRVPARDPVIRDAGIPTQWWGRWPRAGRVGTCAVLRGSVWCNDDDGDGDGDGDGGGGGGGSDGDGGGGEESRLMPTCSCRTASRRERSSDASRAR